MVVKFVVDFLGERPQGLRAVSCWEAKIVDHFFEVLQARF